MSKCVCTYTGYLCTRASPPPLLSFLFSLFCCVSFLLCAHVMSLFDNDKGSMLCMCVSRERGKARRARACVHSQMQRHTRTHSNEVNDFEWS
jgi:hypothetical protein